MRVSRARTVAFGACALVLAALAGCAAPPIAPDAGARAGAPNHWTGRFSVTVVEAGFQPREERASGRFSLRTRDDRKQLELSSPLGQTIAMVMLEADRATLQASNGQVYEANSAEALTEQVFGWRIPVGNLPDWLQGRIASPTEREGGRVVAGLEHGWSVRFDGFVADRPRRLSLDWPAGGGDGLRRLELQLVVDSATRVSASPVHAAR